MLRAMFDGTCKEYLKENQGSYILIDLIEERFPLIQIGDAVFLKSSWWDKSNIEQVLYKYRVKKIQHTELSEKFIDEKIGLFADMILSLYAPSQIIINECYLVKKYVDCNGKEKYFNNLEKIDEINTYLKKYYNKLKTKSGKAIKTIKMPFNTIADENHQQGLSPVHFTRDYYFSMHRQICDIIKKEEEKLRQIDFQKNTLNGRNKEILKKSRQNNVAEYMANFLAFAGNITSFSGKRVLQIGSPFISERVTRTLGVKKWVCMDFLSEIISENEIDLKILNKRAIGLSLEKIIGMNNYIVFKGKEKEVSPVFYDRFDMVVSRSYLESSENLPYTLDLIYRVLKKQGEFIGVLGPIWGGANGSKWHIGADNFSNSRIIPSFAHLLMGYEELYQILKDNYEESQIDFFEKTKEILLGRKETSLNHLFFEDYQFFMKNTLFRYKNISKLNCVKLTDDELSKLQKRYPNNSFDAVSIALYGKK